MTLRICSIQPATEVITIVNAGRIACWIALPMKAVFQPGWLVCPL